MTAQTYYQGNLIDVSGSFTNEAGSAADPTTVTFVYANGAGPTTLTYSGSSSPAVGTIWKTGTGAYVARIDTTGMVGTLNLAFEGTGNVQAAFVHVVTVAANPALAQAALPQPSGQAAGDLSGKWPQVVVNTFQNGKIPVVSFGAGAHLVPVSDGSGSYGWQSRSGAYYVVSGLAQDGSHDDYALIQAALTNCATNGGHVFVPYTGGGGISIIGQSLTIPSNTKLELHPNVTIKSLVVDNLIRNANLTNSRSVWDCQVTAGSPTITSPAIGSFTNADVNKAVTLWPDGDQLVEPWTTTVLSVSSGTVLTLAANAPTGFTSNAAAMSIGPRDSNIEITGGTWTHAHAGSGHGLSDNQLRFKRVDGLYCHDYAVVSTGGVTATCVGDVTDVTIRNFNVNNVSDGINVEGPAKRVDISNIHGNTADDLVAFLGGQSVGLADSAGPITDAQVKGLYPTNFTAPNAIKLIPGSGAQTAPTSYKMRRILVDGLYGNCSGSPVAIWNDVNTGYAKYGDLAGVTIKNVYTKGNTNSPIIDILGSTIVIGDITIDGVYCDQVNSVNQFIRISGMVVGKLSLKNIFVSQSAPSVIDVRTSTTVTDLDIDGLWVQNSLTTPVVLIEAGGTVTTCRIRRANVVLSGSSAMLVQNSGTLLDINVSDSTQAGGFTMLGLGQTGPTVARLSNVKCSGTSDSMVEGHYQFEVDLNGVSYDGAGPLVKVNASATPVIIRGGAVGGTGSHFAIGGGSGQVITCLNPFFKVDASLLTGSVGSIAQNTNAGFAYGAGPVFWNGIVTPPAWRPIGGTPIAQTITHVQEAVISSGGNASATTYTVSLAGVVAGNSLTLAAEVYTAGSTPVVTVADNVGGVWTKVVEQTTGFSSDKQSIWQCVSSPGGSVTVTITSTVAATTGGVAASLTEWSGMGASDRSGAATSISTSSPTSATITPRANNELVLAFTAAHVITGSPAGPWVVDSTPPTWLSAVRAGQVWQVRSDMTGVSAAWTANATGWGVVAASFAPLYT